MKLPHKAGIFQLCAINVEVYLTQGTGGTGWPRINNTSRPRITVGLDQEEWKVYALLLHEAEEFTLLQFGYSFIPTSVQCLDSTTYVYHLDHGELIRVHEETGYFLYKAWPVVQRMYRQYQKEQKKNGS